MKCSILNHLDADDRARTARTLEITLDKLSASASSKAGWGDRGRGFLEFHHLRESGAELQEIRLTIDSERTMLRHRFREDGRYRRCTIVEADDGIHPTRGETMENAFTRLRRWLAQVEEVDEPGMMEEFQNRSRLAADALLAAACRRDDGWSSALAEMGSREAEPCVTLSYPDGRRIARFCGSGEAPSDGTLSAEFRSALHPGAPLLHILSKRSVTDPAPMFTFGPPPAVRIRSDDVSAIRRLAGIADAIANGFELITH